MKIKNKEGGFTPLLRNAGVMKKEGKKNPLTPWSGVTGFTLIEMLVVIAMIGLLSAVVLVALGPSRNKAKDTRIISDLQQVRAVAETLYDGSSGTYPAAATIKGNADVTKASNDITANGGTDFGVVTNGAGNSGPGTAFATFAKLNSGSVYCIDSTGNTVTSSTVPTAPPCQ